MKQILIVYGSKYGCTRKCAEQLQQQMKAKVTLLDVSKWKKGKTSILCDSENRIYDGISNIDLSFYDFIIIGGSFYIGKWQAGVTDFLRLHHNTIQTKKHAFFVCHMNQGNDLETEITQNIPEQLYQTAVAVGRFGGIFDLAQMSGFEKLMVKLIAKTKNEPFTTDTLDQTALHQFIWEIERNL